MRRAAHLMRRDRNDRELLRAAEQLGAVMWRLDEPTDYLCGWRGRWHPTEIKSEDGEYTDQQNRFRALAEGHGLPLWTWRTPDDVLASLGAKVAA